MTAEEAGRRMKEYLEGFRRNAELTDEQMADILHAIARAYSERSARP